MVQQRLPPPFRGRELTTDVAPKWQTKKSRRSIGAAVSFWRSDEERTTDRARCPSTDNRASYRADSSAGTAGRSRGGAAPPAASASSVATSLPSAATHFP